MPKAKLGDMIEIPTRKGLFYAQFTHKNPLMGQLIRVFDARFNARPTLLDEVAASPVRFNTFFPVDDAIKRNIFPVIGNAAITAHNREFPLFRSGAIDPKTGRVEVWWLWDGTNESKIGALSSDQQKLSIRGIWNDTLLIERLEEGWRPETNLYGV